MRAPKRWIEEYAALPAGLSGRELADVLVSAGLEVEAVDSVGGDISGPVVIGRVVGFVEEPQKNGKTIRWCHVDVGADHAPEKAPGPLVKGDVVAELPGGYWPRGVICGALNFVPGDHVVVALPGSVLPGGFGIGSRKTYGHISDGMICAEDELGLGEDHAGIMVLGDADDSGRARLLGEPALPALGVLDEVLDMPITSDMGYCLSIRGLAREAAQALGVAFTDPVALATPASVADGYPVRIESDECRLFVALTVSGLDATRPTPRWMATRLAASGMRSINLPVDVSNYVMLETGQPNHCYDADALSGAIVVRTARAGERLVTLDGADRALDVADLVIADDSGPIGLAGVMGGESSELSTSSTRVVIEAASFDPVAVARMSRRHKLSSEASKRFERYVDPGAAYSAARRVADLLIELGGGVLETAETVAGFVPAMPAQTIDVTLPERVLGMPAPADRVVSILEASGVSVVRTGDTLELVPPSWRHDLVDPYDYVEEVGIKIGLEHLPSVVPAAPAGRGLSRSQVVHRALGAAVARAGFVEVLCFPWGSEADADALGLDAGDPRRRAVRLANPLADTAPLLRTTLLPGLFGAVARNRSRGQDDLALFEVGRVFFSSGDEVTPLPGMGGRPSDADLDAIAATLPVQPTHLGAVLTGEWRPQGWDGPAVQAGWEQAFGLVETIADACGVRIERRAAQQAPWHPGRCAALVVDGAVIGHAGELHPRVIKAFGLPARSAAVELDQDALIAAGGAAGVIVPVSGHPVAKEDVALVVDESVPAADLQAALAVGGGDLLESVRLFDIYRGAPVPEGKKSVAFALRFRASDRTLTDAEIAAAREAAVAKASALGAELRG
ncbi:MAG: phenylalanine--tRNA ligase subunit beta [Propioniciclava sp.]|uniref:phenylalanine--tRNA ligase subunit beta n=1 Tax=Propioniciclava sp. TaxID=2038686 RepID=UPI0039E5A4B0